MATYYVDNNNGSDTAPGDGSQANPFKTYGKAFTMLGGNGQHAIYLKCGTVEDLGSSSASMRSGTSPTARSLLASWGEGPKPVLRMSGANTGGVMWHLAGSQYKTVRGIVFDANRVSKFGHQIYSNTTAITDLVFEGCEFANTSLIANADSSYIQSETAFPLISGVVFKDCKFYGASRHGAHNVGNVSALYIGCESFNNGLFDPGGGHGFSSFAGTITNFSSGWTLVSGTIYKRTVTATVWHVMRTTGTPLALLRNTATPTAPASGEWGESAGELYVNIGSDPNSSTTIRISQWAPTVVYRYCSSHHNVASDAPRAEGTGFQADDLTGSFTAIGCRAYANDGPGFFINQGRDAVIRDCLAYDNGNFGFAGQYASGVQLDGITSANNCLANRSGYNGDVKFQLGSRDVKFRNSVVQKGASTIATASIRFDTDSQVGCSLTDVVYFGAPLSIGSATQTRVSNVDPRLSAQVRPLSGSPLVAAGTHLGYRRDVDGKQRQKPPTIGAYDAATMARR